MLRPHMLLAFIAHVHQPQHKHSCCIPAHNHTILLYLPQWWQGATMVMQMQCLMWCHGALACNPCLYRAWIFHALMSVLWQQEE